MALYTALKAANPQIPIHRIHDEAFRAYGRVIDADTAAICAAAEAAVAFPGEGSQYFASVPELEALPELSGRILDLGCGWGPVGTAIGKVYPGCEILMTDVNERAAYAYTKERRVRLASFCASGNRRDFLTDITGNRRWLPFEVESIQNPFHTIIPYERLYAQAKALVEEGMFSYWFDMEEMEVLEAHNEEFRAQENEEELLKVYFAVPATDSMNAKFLTTAEISEKLISAGNIKRPMSLSRLGMILGQHGFIAVF